jgi:hypothetical protein
VDKIPNELLSAHIKETYPPRDRLLVHGEGQMSVKEQLPCPVVGCAKAFEEFTQLE